MTKTESVVRSIFGPVRCDLRPLVYAVDIVIDLMFVQDIAMDEIFVTDDVYPEVTKVFRNRVGHRSNIIAISRRIERLCNRCWDTLEERDLVEVYVGTPVKDIRAPRDILFYLAFYVYLDIPFYDAIQNRPVLLFEPK